MTSSFHRESHMELTEISHGWTNRDADVWVVETLGADSSLGDRLPGGFRGTDLSSFCT